ncbi:exodeoxyribonuclease-3 [Paenibacillus sp. V4I3]|uniref:endonuclease/exonuclease/phosphatase family protein n=1 Tax=Paenibacillus sp. V4I3 TaxID=3042305 RepID=UPI00278818ED|nr:endonuclease/exonuclease/phosphatase family protein [Paenibacillus sp. V4I3]MDQ0871347.1 exodeoxyribonuclease-3 [Paenibacillus sp. V4I3]
MRIITWNCNQSFKKKCDLILSFVPDIIVIQESEKFEQVDLDRLKRRPTQYFWCGDKVKKGISVFNFSITHTLTELECDLTNNNRWVLPFKLEGDTFNFNLFAVWAMNHRGGNSVLDKVRPIYRTFQGFSNLLSHPTVIVGDFNNHTFWDNEFKTHLGSFSDILSMFREYQIHSSYHEYNQLQFGAENQHTLSFRKNLNAPYHIDYCFCSKTLLDNLKSIVIEKREEWIKSSDHVPLIMDL